MIRELPHRRGTEARRITSSIAAAGVLLLASACGDDADGDAAADADPTESVAPAAPGTTLGLVPRVGPDPDLAEISVVMTEVANVDQPMALATRGGDDALFVAEREGRVYRLEPDEVGSDGGTYTRAEDPLVDISDEVVLEEEQALSGMTLSPDGKRIYLSYSAAPSGDTSVISFELDDSSSPNVDEATRRDILSYEQPYNTHNNGQIIFGPDGYLYLGLGDGGHIGDPNDYGQDTTSLLGTIVRIDPEGVSEDDSDEPYLIPEDNPWRFTFDAVTGDLWIGDVGQETREEINLLPAADGTGQAAGRGANLGWSEMEGALPFEDGDAPDDVVLPAFDYPNHREGGEGGCAVVGGYVYRGAAIPDLEGVFLFGDFCNPQIRGLTVDDGDVTAHTPLPGIATDGIVSLGQDGEGEIYLLSEPGAIYRIDPAPAP
jgi:glucose/arabinose dehydrogenase